MHLMDVEKLFLHDYSGTPVGGDMSVFIVRPDFAELDAFMGQQILMNILVLYIPTPNLNAISYEMIC